MITVDQLMAQYIGEYRESGEADPAAFLARASPADRLELAALIDAYLVRAPRRAFDETAYRNSAAQRTAAELDRALAGQSGLWPALLPELRHRAGLQRAELVRRLAQLLGVGDREAKVATYYHQMEQGILPAAGVSTSVLDALAQIVGETTAALREAGGALRPFSGESATAAVFARTAQSEPGEPPLAAAPPDPAEWDQVDHLFRSV